MIAMRKQSIKMMMIVVERYMVMMEEFHRLSRSRESRQRSVASSLRDRSKNKSGKYEKVYCVMDI